MGVRGFVSVKVEGMDRIARNLRAIPDAISKDQIETMLVQEVAPPIVSDMQSGAPRSAGLGHAGGGQHAADLITALPTPIKRGDLGVAEVEIGPTKKGYYLIFPEFGTHKMAARPFMRPAWDAHATRVPQQISNGLAKIVHAAIASRGGA